MNSSKRGLFVNCRKAQDSIYESGYMVFNCLALSELYELDYCEVDKINRSIKTGYDFYFFNYHPVTMGWMETRHLKRDLGFVITMILEVAPGDAFILCPENDFDIYCALDPTISPSDKLYAFPRPLESINFTAPEISHNVPVIGSFGFATKGKGFQHVVEAVNKEFTEAIIRINIPYGDFVPESQAYSAYLGQLCKDLAKPGITVQVTHEFMSKEELIKWCAENTLNCFLYDRKMPGLAATTDQAIITGRPLCVSDNDTFRHILQYIKPYPTISLREAIDNSTEAVNQMKNDWSRQKFSGKFDEIFLLHKDEMTSGAQGEYTLHTKQFTLNDIINSKIKRYKRKLRNFKFKNLLGGKDAKFNKEII